MHPRCKHLRALTDRQTDTDTDTRHTHTHTQTYFAREFAADDGLIFLVNRAMRKLMRQVLRRGARFGDKQESACRVSKTSEGGELRARGEGGVRATAMGYRIYIHVRLHCTHTHTHTHTHTPVP